MSEAKRFSSTHAVVIFQNDNLFLHSDTFSVYVTKPHIHTVWLFMQWIVFVWVCGHDWDRLSDTNKTVTGLRHSSCQCEVRGEKR